LLVRFWWLAGFCIVFALYQLYLNQMLQIRWRRWLTDRYLHTWLTESAYYRMQLRGDVDNPDQRIEADVPQFISGTLTLAIGGMRAAVTLISFVTILWGLSGTLSIHIGLRPFTLQAGYRYQLSILQLELSLTQVLDRPVSGRIFFEEVLRENLDIGSPKQIQLIFERWVTRATPGPFRTRVITDGVIPSLHVEHLQTSGGS
jgi:vitamin B12/bleomycin/antimicrobial peptide transport system ATP-binding/permease protein